MAIDASPWGRERERTVVQLLVRIPPEGALSTERAKQRLDRFVDDFHEALRAL